MLLLRRATAADVPALVVIARLLIAIAFGLLPGASLVSFVWEDAQSEPQPLPESTATAFSSPWFSSK